MTCLVGCKLCQAGAGPGETGAVAENDREPATGEAVMIMPPTGQPQMPFPGMPMMHMRPGMPGMPPNFRGMMMPFVSVTPYLFLFCSFCDTDHFLCMH